VYSIKQQGSSSAQSTAGNPGRRMDIGGGAHGVELDQTGPDLLEPTDRDEVPEDWSLRDYLKTLDLKEMNVSSAVLPGAQMRRLCEPCGWCPEPCLVCVSQWILHFIDPRHEDIKWGKGATDKARSQLTTIHEDPAEAKSIIYAEPALSAALKTPPKTVDGKLSLGASSRCLVLPPCLLAPTTHRPQRHAASFIGSNCRL